MNIHKLDGILLISAYDCSYSKPMHQLIKWLLFGCSSMTSIDEFSIPPEFSETFMIITQSQIYIFSHSSTRDFFYELTSKICNVELFITSKKEEEISETLEVQKISKSILNGFHFLIHPVLRHLVMIVQTLQQRVHRLLKLKIIISKVM